MILILPRWQMIAVALLLFLMVQGAQAQRAEINLANLPASVVNTINGYYDLSTSVKDFSCDVKVVNAEDKSTSVLQGRFYFKAPDKTKFVSADGGRSAADVQDLMARDLSSTAVVRFLMAAIPPPDWSESKNAGGVKLQGKFKGEGQDRRSATIEISSSGTLKALAIGERDGSNSMEIWFSTVSRTGKRLLTGVTARLDETQKWNWEYATVGGRLVVSKAVSAEEPEVTRTTTCGNYKFDQGLADSMF